MKKNFLWFVVAFFFAFTAASRALSAEAPEWQAAGAGAGGGFHQRYTHIMGLRAEASVPTPGFVVLNSTENNGNAAWPRLGLTGFPGKLDGKGTELPSIVTIGLHTASTPYYCDFGELRLPDRQLQRLAKAEGDWSSLVFEYTAAGSQKPVLTLLASRASPALLLRADAESLVLFSKRRIPVPKPSGSTDQPWPDWRQAGAPMLAAMPEGDGVKIIQKPSLAEPDAGKFDIDPEHGTWLLLWFGKDSGFFTTTFPYSPFQAHNLRWRNWHGNPIFEEGDCPVLVLFDEPPWSVFVGGDGLEIIFETSKKKEHAVAVLPLYGNRFVPASETETWRAKLPERVVAQCRWWDEHLGAFPASVTETYKYNEADGSVTITEHVRYEPFRESGKKLAPLPPMAALALEQGFPLKLAKADGSECRWTPSSVVTIHGPYGGVPDVESFSWTVPGMGRLVKERPVAGPAVAADARLARQLEEQVRRIVEAGHLAPWYCSQNSWSAGYRGFLLRTDRLVWSNPAETLYTLAQALPFLESGLQSKALEYMRAERAAFPPEKTAHTPVVEGARREWHRHSEDIETYTEIQGFVNSYNFYLANKLVPEETLYFMAHYLEAAGINGENINDLIEQILTPYIWRQDWATLGFWPPAKEWGACFVSFDGHGGVIDANRHFAALLGALRMKLMSGADSEIDEFWGMLARAAIWRFALGKYGKWLYAAGFMRVPEQPDWQAEWWEGSNLGRMITWNWTSPEHDIRQVCMQSPYMIDYDEFRSKYNGLGINPFLGAVPELGRFAAEYLKAELKTYSDRYEQTIPAWFIAKATTEYGAEFNYTPPEDPWQIFMIRAWALGESSEQLEKYLDIPWMARGDLYYIQKLVETIKAYRGVKWQ